MNSQNILSKDEFKNEKFFWEKGLIPEAWKTPEEQETERWIQIRRKAVIAEKQVMQTAPDLYAPKAMQKALEAKQFNAGNDKLKSMMSAQQGQSFSPDMMSAMGAGRE